LIAGAARPGVVDRGIVKQVKVVVLDGLAGFQRLENDALDQSIAQRIGEHFLGDPPLAAVGGRHDLPQHGALIDQADLVQLLPALFVAPGFIGIGDQQLQVDVLHRIECGIKDFGQDSLGAGEIDAGGRAGGRSEKVLGSWPPDRGIAGRARRLQRQGGDLKSGQKDEIHEPQVR